MEPDQQTLTPEQMYYFKRQRFVIADFETRGCILDIGGGGEGIIGRLKGSHVVSIDNRREELEQAPPGPLKIVMDACNLQFLDNTFQTVTSFCSLLYISKAEYELVFREVYRVLASNGQFLIWDFNLPVPLDPDKEIAVFPVSVFLPDQEEIRTGYGSHWPDFEYSCSYFAALAEKIGFKIIAKREKENSFFLELHKMG